MSIIVESITKKYGEQLALDQVSFSIQKGEIVGFLGPNGAGKSTLMKILTTYISPDEGQAQVDGFDIYTQKQDIKKIIGYLPEHNPLYLELYVREYLIFCANAYHINTNRVEEVIQLTGLTAEANKTIGQLSKGYRQRVGLAAALIHEPKVLILDEPTTGLDPNQLVEIRQLIKNIAKDRTIFLSTHIMQEVEAICNRVIIINHGKIVSDRPLKNLKSEQTVQVLDVEFDKSLTINLSLQGLMTIENIASNQYRLTFENDTDQRASLFDFAAKNDLKILSLQQKTKNLEEIFREKTKD
jgi:ABC-2 type transport system ATP-binding protein